MKLKMKNKVLAGVFLLIAVFMLGNVKGYGFYTSNGGVSNGGTIISYYDVIIENFQMAERNILLFPTNRTNTSITMNWTYTGSTYNYSELFRNGVLIYNGTGLNFTDVNLTNSTWYFYNLSVYYVNYPEVVNTYYNYSTMHNEHELGSQSENWNMFWVWVMVYVGVWLMLWKNGYYFTASVLFLINSILGAYFYANAIVSMHIFINAIFAITQGLSVLKEAEI